MKLLHIGIILLLGACSVDKEVTPPAPTHFPATLRARNEG